MLLALVLMAAVTPAAPSPMPLPYPVVVNGHAIGNAQMIGGTLALPLEDLARAVDGTVSVAGGMLKLLPAVSPRDPQSGLPTGQRMHKPFVITKEIDKATPLLYIAGKAYIPVPALANLLGGTYTGPTAPGRGQTIQLNFTTNPRAIIAVR